MGGSGQHVVRPADGAGTCRGVESSHGNAEATRLAADVVERGQAVIAVKGSVLDALGHHRRRDLLELHGEGLQAFAERGATAAADIGGQHAFEKIVDAGVGIRAVFLGHRHRPGNVAAIVGRQPAVGDVAAIDREAGHHFHQRLAQPVEGEVAGVPAGGGDARQAVGEHVELARQGGAHDQLLGVVGKFFEVAVDAAEVAVDTRHAPLGGAIDEQVVDQVGEAVAGRAVDRPVVRQALVVGEDLLDHQIQRQRFARRRGLAADGLLQVTEVLARIVEPIRMVDAQPLDLALGDEIENEAVGGVEHRRVFHAQRGEVVDVEKAPVVDLVGGDTPVGEAVALELDQLVQQVEAGGITGAAVEFRQIVGDMVGDIGAASLRAARWRLCTSLSRWRSAMRSGVVSVRAGRWPKAVSRVCSSP